MILRTKGKALNIDQTIVAPVTRIVEDSKNKIFLDDLNNGSPTSHSGLCTLSLLKDQGDFQNQGKTIYKIPRLDHLLEGDIVAITSDGAVITLYRLSSNQNTLMATERCNSNCLMCSQPPKDRDDIDVLYEINVKLIPLIPKDCQELGISGGEPTLMGDRFFKLLELIKIELPETQVHILSNGRSFAWSNFASKLMDINMPNVMYGIPLYSDDYAMHDYIVQAKNAFYQTILGIHNLARYQQRIEIRIVLHQQTIPRLKKLAEYIYKNMPFVNHVAFMGLEYIGYTPHNIDKLWIDPYEYQEELSSATEYLSGYGINVSIYNTPLCVLPEHSWRHARKSISDWKNDYMEECAKCSKKDDCGGFFTWNLKKHSNYIKAFQ